MARRSTTGKHRVLLHVAVAAVLSAAACGVIDSQTCTDAGCLDMATIRLESADGSQHTYDITLNVDGREVTCATPALPSPTDFSTQPCSDAQVSISHGPLADCTETRTTGAISQSCVLNGKFAQTIEFRATPARVGVALVDAEGANFQRTFDLEYVTTRPNGPECGPVCEQANGDWVVQ